MAIHQITKFLDSTDQSVRAHSLVQYRSWQQKSKHTGPVFVDVDLSEKPVAIEDLLKDLFLKEAIPVLVWPKEIGPELVWSSELHQQIEQRFAQSAEVAAQVGHDMLVLSADEDGLLHQILSPRFFPNLSWDSRLEIVLSYVRTVQKCIPSVGVALTVEELCPGGLDATNGIEAALAMEQRGVAFILANAGTRDFPALKNRRATKLKEGQADLSECQDVDLASSLWLVNSLKIPVFALSCKFSGERTVRRAKEHKLAGIVSQLTA